MTFGLRVSPDHGLAQWVGQLAGAGLSAPHCNRAWRPLAEQPRCWPGSVRARALQACARGSLASRDSVSVGLMYPDVSAPTCACGSLVACPHCCLTVSLGGVQSVAFWNLNLCACLVLNLDDSLSSGDAYSPSAPPSAGQAENFHP